MTADNWRDRLFRSRTWPRIRGALFHRYFLLRRAMTLGVRAVILDKQARTVFLIRHTYVSGWQLPGGGVELGETMVQSLERECAEEGNIVFTAPPVLQSIHQNRAATRRDHVAVYLVEGFTQTSQKLPDMEIAEAGFFALDALPEGTTQSTRRRIDEALGSLAPDPYW